MSISTFRVKHPRPRKLSDPYHDFSPDMLEELLAIPDDKLKEHQYLQLLGPILPAGTYEESVYFLPGAFRYLIVQSPDDYLDIIPSVIGFVSKNTKYLEKDRILDEVRACIRECFTHWTSHFIVVHRRSGNDERNRTPAYGDYVRNSETIQVAIRELVKWEQPSDLAEAFVQELADNTSNPLKAAWYLEYARASRDRLQQPLNNQRLSYLSHNKAQLQKAAQLVRQHLVSTEQSPTYWRDTFRALKLS